MLPLYDGYNLQSDAEHLYLLDWCEPPFTFGTLCLRAGRHSSRQRLLKLAFNTLLISQNLIFRLSTLGARRESQAIIWQNINIKEDDRSYKGRDKGQTLLFSFLLNYLFSISSIYLLRSRPALHNVDFYAPNRLLWWISQGFYLPLIDAQKKRKNKETFFCLTFLPPSLFFIPPTLLIH